jgi:hypothetical protein
MITHRIPIDELPASLQALSTGSLPAAIKVVVEM